MFSPFKLALQKDMAERFVRYINDLDLRSPAGEPLTFDGPRDGSYYRKILGNLSGALNAFMAGNGLKEDWLLGRYGAEGALPPWLERRGDRYAVTDLAGFLRGTGLDRNKDIPGFDTFWKTAENNAFGSQRQAAVHYAPLTAELLRDNRERYSALPGFQACDVDDYIREPEGDTTGTFRQWVESIL